MVQFRVEERLSTVNAAGHRWDNCRLHQFYVYVPRCDFVLWTRLDDCMPRCIIAHCTRDEFPWRARPTCSSLPTARSIRVASATLSESQSLHFFNIHDAQPGALWFSVRSKQSVTRFATQRITSSRLCPSMTTRRLARYRRAVSSDSRFSQRLLLPEIARCIYAHPMNFQKRSS